MIIEKGRLNIANYQKNLLYLGQTYIDPRDALNEFISNCADEYKEASIERGKIQVELHRKGEQCYIKISDFGRGMSKDKLSKVANSLCESEKALLPNKDVIGEKGIGILGFMSLAQECHIVSRLITDDKTYCLILKKGEVDYEIREETKRKKTLPGTDVFLYEVTPENFRVLTLPKLENYFKERRRPALMKGDYEIQICEGKKGILVRPDSYGGMPYPINRKRTDYGFVEFSLFLWHTPNQKRKVSVVGKGGTTIIEDITNVDEFNCPPWNSDHVEGEITFTALEQTSGRKGIIRDTRKFPVFVASVKEIENLLLMEIEKLKKENEEKIDTRVFSIIRSIFSKILSELEDVDSPVKIAVASKDGREEKGGLSETETAPGDGRKTGGNTIESTRESHLVDSEKDGTVRQKTKALPNWYPKSFEPEKAYLRSEFDKDLRVIYYNDMHPDYLREKREALSRLNYILFLTIKEYVLYNNPKADEVTISEEMIRFLVRARKHIPKQL